MVFVSFTCLHSRVIAFEVETKDGYLVVKKPLVVGVAVVPSLKRVGDRDQWGTPLPLIEHRGKYYLVAEKGKRFGLDLKVPKKTRCYFVTAIDGINVLADTSDHPGYVVTSAQFPGDNTLSGWRFDAASVHRFVFTATDQSLAATIGRLNDARRQDIGTISVTVLAEYAPLKQVAGNTRGLGTGMGERVDAPIESTAFKRGELVAKFVIHYASKEELSNDGISAE